MVEVRHWCANLIRLPVYLAVTTVTALAGGVASVSGMGIGSLITPLLAYKYGMKTAVAAVSRPSPRRHSAPLLYAAPGRRLDRLCPFRPTQGALLLFAGLAGLIGYSERMRFGPPRRVSPPPVDSPASLLQNGWAH
jgi:hypothetical protein